MTATQCAARQAVEAELLRCLPDMIATEASMSMLHPGWLRRRSCCALSGRRGVADGSERQLMPLQLHRNRHVAFLNTQARGQSASAEQK